MADSWRPLKVSGDTNLPPLLISNDFQPGAYTVRITDLTRIWVESLDRKEVEHRSEEVNTSIDPSDEGQLRILLNKLKLGVEAGPDTTSSLGADAGRLVFRITVKLPSGLRALKWPFYLSEASRSLTTRQLTVPMLYAQHKRMQELASLAEALKEKDVVIQKLLDKLEAQGADLGEIFAQAGVKAGRKVDRRKAAEKVRGLGPFDMNSWRKELNEKQVPALGDLVTQVFGEPSSRNLAVPATGDQLTVPENWWEELDNEPIDLGHEKAVTSKIAETPIFSRPALRTKLSVEDADDFQVQSTPPRHASTRSVKVSKVVNDETTEDDTESDLPVRPLSKRNSLSRSPSSFSPVAENIADASAGQSDLKASTAARSSLAEPGSSPADEQDAPKRPNVSAAQATVKPKRKLGKVGGKKEVPPPPDEQVCPPKQPASVPGDAPKPKKGKLGQLGGKKKATPSTVQPDPQPSRGRDTSSFPRPTSGIDNPPEGQRDKMQLEGIHQAEDDDEEERKQSVKPEEEKTLPPRETSEERRTQRRVQLKRELEEKSKGQAKKKKKF